MSRYFTSSVAATALIAMLAGPVLAQDAPQTNAPAAPAAEAQAPVELPQVLKDAGLTDVTSKKMRRGSRVTAKLPDGAGLVILLNDQGELRGLRSGERTALPAMLIERLVPQPVRGQQIYGQLGNIVAVFMDERGVMLAGRDAQDNPVRAAFAQDGTLLRFGRGDDHGPRMRGDDDRHGDKRHGDRDDRDHGKRKHDDKHRDRMDRRGDAERGGPRDDAAGAADVTPLAPDEIRTRLTDAGYTAVGQILQQGRITIAQATNPEGETVLVEIAPNGRIVRELNR